MYCPKCKETFEEGSRRFCPTDGSRLISESTGSNPERKGGIFGNLIPKIEAVSDLDETLSDFPSFTISEPKGVPTPAGKKAAEPDIFFELDDLQPEPDPVPPVFVRLAETPETQARPIARKVQPFEIPAGHVDLGGADRAPGIAADFIQSDPGSFVGRVVKGRYKVTEFLGGDETGLAYLADDKIVADKMVLVRILPENESDEILGSILAEERVSLSHFSHPNIARLIDSGEFTSGTTFLISEYVDALSVNDILSIHGQFDASRTARVIRQAASALNEAHQEGILHRDLRPENLIIDTSAGETEQTKLVNFGASNGEPTAQNIAYKAPEILDGRIATIASDIFSLGAVAYEMLTGRIPFDGSTPREIFRAQNAGLEIPPTQTRPDLPHSVDDILKKALSFNAAERFPKARDFGDALYAALAEPAPQVILDEIPDASESGRATALFPGSILELEPAVTTDKAVAVKSPAAAIPPSDEPAWKNRSPEPPAHENSLSRILGILGILAVLGLLGFGLYYVVNRVPPLADQTANSAQTASPTVSSTEMPPMPRNISQPPNTNFYENSKQNLKGDLLRNFVGFKIYYPKDWKVNGPQESASATGRGKFLDISRSTLDGRLKEQMLISYYPSKGTFAEDTERFRQMVNETNETLKKLLPGYQMVSEGEIKINGDWSAYQIKFQGGGTSESGEKLVVWGRRLFIPAARPGVRNGFEITMLATSLADDVRSVDDIGVHGELAAILDSFEPSQNF